MRGRQVGEVFIMETEKGFDILLADKEGKSRVVSVIVDSSVPGNAIFTATFPVDMAYMMLHNEMNNVITMAVQTSDIPPQPEEMDYLHPFVKKEIYGMQDGPYVMVPKRKRRRKKDAMGNGDEHSEVG